MRTFLNSTLSQECESEVNEQEKYAAVLCCVVFFCLFAWLCCVVSLCFYALSFCVVLLKIYIVATFILIHIEDFHIIWASLLGMPVLAGLCRAGIRLQCQLFLFAS